MAKRQRRKRKGKGRRGPQGGDVESLHTEDVDDDLLNLATPDLPPPEPVDPAPAPQLDTVPDLPTGDTRDTEPPDVQQPDTSMAAWTSEGPEGSDSDLGDGTQSGASHSSDRAQSGAADTNDAETLEERLAEDDFEGSLPLLEAALLERPTDIDLLLLAGQTYTELGDHARAQVQFRAALELRPDDLPLQRELGFSLFRRGVYAEAAEALSVVCARSESDGEAYYYRGEAQNRSGQTEAAAETLEKAARLSPSDGRVLLSLGRIYDRLGMPEKAAENYGKARKLPSPASGV